MMQLLIIGFGLIGQLLLPFQAQAQAAGGGSPLGCAQGANPFTSCLRELAGLDLPQAASESEEAVQSKVSSAIRQIILFLTSAIALLAMAALIVGSIMYITSLGNDSRVALAKRIIFWALIGVVVAIMAALLTNITISILSGAGLVEGGQQ